MNLAHERPRFGYRRLRVLLAREGEHVNHKRLFRVYREAGLSVKRNRRKKLVRVGVKQPVLTAPNQEWSLDFVSDALADGRTLRVLTVVDNFTRECLALEADTSFSGERVTRVLDRAIDQRDRPAAIRMDNGLNARVFFRTLIHVSYGSSFRRPDAEPDKRKTPSDLPRMQWEPAEHNKHKIGGAVFTGLETAWEPSGRSEHYLRGQGASTARVRGIDPLGSRCSENG